MATAGNITAVLTLNSSGFQEGLNSSITAIEKFKSSFSGNITPLSKDVESLQSALRLLSNTLDGSTRAINNFSVNAKSLSQFKNYSESVNKLANALKILSSSTIDAEKSTNIINNMFKYFQNTLNGTEIKIKGVSTVVKEFSSSEMQSSMSVEKATSILQRNSDAMQKNAQAKLRSMGYTGSLTAEENGLAVTEEKVAGATDRATNSMNKQTSASKGLGKALSSLKMMGTMVGSMIAYNFVHNLAMATTETINAKSEMEGYFKMLHFGQGQINNFNKALDETVKKFPRLNKYALGETISSIGVEFELTTAEMKKAMPVVSMITSEYLRAGRNVNEASLAVKDILQGEFQRLSRETGVKGDQLKEAGWSGDKNDVMGLLEALDKVGKARNWDVFVQKANSLNDAVLITQNRFSEWSADMVERVQPAILSVFNDLMVVGTDFAKVFNNVLDWLSGNGIAQNIVKWGALSIAIANALTGLIAYRTGANLTQIAQMGLTKSIGASILGLEAQTVAEHGLRNAIVQSITSIEAETLAENLNISTRRARWVAIMSTITGIEAETVAEMGLTKSLFSSIFALDMQTVKQKGFLVALGSAITGIEAETFALKSHNVQLLLTASSIGVVAGALAILTGYFVIQAMKINDAIDKYNRFRNILEHGDETIKEYKDTLDDLTAKKKELSDKLNTLTKDSYEYKYVADQLVATNQDLDYATKNYANSVNAVAWSKHKQELYDNSKQQAQLQTQRKINEALIDYGVNVKEANEISSPIWTDAIDGWNQQYETLQKVNLQYSKNATTVTAHLNQLNKLKIDPKEVKIIITPLVKSGNKIAEAKEKMGQATGFMEYIDAWLWLQYWQIDHAISEFWVNNKIDTGKAVNGFLKGFGMGLDSLHLPMNELIEGILNSINFDFETDGLQLEQPFNLPSIIGEWIGNWIKQSVDWEGLDETITNICNDITDFDIIGAIINAILPAPASASDGTSDHPSFMEDVSAMIGFDIQSWVDSFSSDPLGTLGIVLPTVTIDSISQWVYNSFVKPIGNGLLTGIQQIPIVGSIVSLFGLVTDENVSASNKGRMIAHWIGNGINTAIGEIPIVGDILRMLGLIPSTNSDARNKGYGVGQNIKQGVQNGYTGLTDSIRTEMSNVISVISKKAGETYAVAHDIGSKILKGIQDALDMHSPSIISRELIANEFGVYIPQAITDNSDVAYNSAYSYAEKIKEGISNAGTTTIGMDTMVDDYETDAQTIALSSKMMGNDTTSAFNQMQMSVNATTNQMQTNVVGTYSQIQSKQASSLTTMKNQNISAYNDMYLKSNQSMIQMRDSTTNVTHQMTNAWNLMKNNIVASAQKIKTDSEVRFNSLSTTIGGFYRKIQNPSQWGGGAGHGTSTRVARKPSVGKALVRGVKSRGGYAGGLNTKPNNATMTISQLKRQLCPSGDCGNLFDGYNMNDTVNVWDFLQSIGGEHGLGGWNFAQSHYNYIKNKSDAWDTAPPVIDLVGGIPTSKGFKVSEFNDGTPKISFSTFEQIATSIFSTIPYKFYFDSSWKGSWLGALQSGACNCYDGALALIALANTFGFSGSMAHGTWTDPSGKKTAHVWAVINGVKMDTTGMQQRGTWRPSSSAGGNPYGSQDSKTVNITVDMSNATVYGVEDLDSKIQESVSKGLQAEFNDPYTITI